MGNIDPYGVNKYFKVQLFGYLIMSKFLFRVLLVSGLIFASGAMADQTPLRHFAEFSTWSQMRISPSGDYIAGVVDKNSGLGGSSLMVMDAKTLENLHEIKMTGSAFIGNFVWANDERLIAWEAVKSGIQEVPYSTGNIIAVNIDGTKKRWIYGSGKQSKSHLSRHSKRAAAFLEHTLPDDDKNVLMSVYTYGSEDGAYTRLVKLNIYTGREQNLARSPIKRAGLTLDGDGELRFAYGVDLDDDESFKAFVREGKDWRLIKQAKKNEGSFVPVGFSSDNKTAYILDNIETDTQALYSYEMSSGDTQLMYRHPFVDVDQITFSGEEQGSDVGDIAGLWVEPDYPMYVPLSEDLDYNKVLVGLQRQFPQYSVDIISKSGKGKDGSQLGVVGVRSDKLPGMYLLYDFATSKLTKIRQAHSFIDSSKLSSTVPYKLTMRDGKTVYAYLTLPEGAEGPVPLIMHPHGGPYGPRDSWGYNAEVQMLASRGYGVLQVNFRGSGGYGKDFMYSAYKQWAFEMQDDLTDSVRWAIDSGITEEGRVCIYGASYGGYSALMSAVKEPDLYACTAGYVGVYDLELMSQKGDIQRRDEGLDFISEAICSTAAECKRGSPLTYIDDLKADVMIIHGAIDQRVPLAHAEALRKALDERDKPYEWMVKRKEGHGFVNVDNREELYERLLAFFKRNIGS